MKKGFTTKQSILIIGIVLVLASAYTFIENESNKIDEGEPSVFTQEIISN